VSLILEALRKSEAERQLGRVPGLLTPISLAPRRRSRRQVVWVALLALVLAALAGAWWLGRNGVAVSAPNVDAPPASNDAAPTDATPPPGATPPAAAPEVSSAAAVAPTPPATVKPILPVAGPADLPSDPDFTSTERESRPMPPPASALQPPPPVALEPLPAQAPIETPTTPSEPPVILLRNVSQAERSELPPLRLSMHVYNDDPAGRFVLIDGRRRMEGDRITKDVVLLAIRRDGALLDLRGRSVLIERP